MAKNNKSDITTATATIDEIKEAAHALLKENGDKVVYATADGNLFLEHSHSLALDHALKTNQELIIIKAE